jgi:hypothetical protein
MAASSSSGFLLSIERGRTRFPQRPILADRFLIGAGSNCHLQLGGDIPFLHSIIIPEGDHLWIDAVVAEPPLLVNGQAVREAELRRGDVLEIGSFVFSIGYSASVAAAPNRPDPQSMTAVQLLDAIGSEMQRLTQFASDREQAAKTLIDAAIRAQGSNEGSLAATSSKTGSETPPLRKTA